MDLDAVTQTVTTLALPESRANLDGNPGRARPKNPSEAAMLDPYRFDFEQDKYREGEGEGEEIEGEMNDRATSIRK